MEEFISNYNVFYVFYFLLVLPHVYRLELNAKLKDNISIYDSLLTITALTLCVLAVGFRDYSVGTDTESYIRDFRIVGSIESLKDALKIIRGGADPLFTTISYLMSRVGGETLYLVFLAILYIVPLGYFIFLNTIKGRSILLLAFLSIYSFKWMAVNTMRSGIALAFGLLFIYYASRKQNRKALILALLAVNFHLSALLFIAAFFLSRIIKRNLVLYLVIGVSSFMAIIGIGFHSIPIIAKLGRLTAYIEGNQDYQTGFSITYWAYNTIIFFYHFFFRRIIKDSYYDRLGSIYIFLSSIYFLSFNIAYSDRIGVFSWAMIPIIISYPFIKYRFIDKYQMPVLMIIVLSFQSLAVFYLKR